MHPRLPELVAHVQAYDSDAAGEVYRAIVRDVAAEPARALATYEAIADAVAPHDEDGWRAKALLAAVALATERGEAVRADGLVVSLVAAYAHDRERGELAALLARLGDHAGEPVRELRLRHAIDDVLVRGYGLDALVRTNLVAAGRLEAALPVDALAAEHAAVRLAVVTRLVETTRGATEHTDTHAHALERLRALATASAHDPAMRDAVIRADLAIAAADPVLAQRHATRAAELAAATADASLRDQARSTYGELLFEAGLLERAEAIVARELVDAGVLADPAQPLEFGPIGADDPAGERLGTHALLAAIRRARGGASPPPEAFVGGEQPGPLDAPPEALPAELAAMFARSDDLTEALRRVPSEQTIRLWSFGEVRAAGDLDSEKIFGPRRSYACRCERYLGGVYRAVICQRCGVELLDRSVRETRPGHIVLRAPVVHPWHAATIAHLLAMKVREVEAADAAELRTRLADMRYHRGGEIELLRERTPDAPRVRAFDALRAAGIDAEVLVLEAVPVWPLASPRLADPRAVRAAYEAILAGEDPSAIARLFTTLARQLAHAA